MLQSEFILSLYILYYIVIVFQIIRSIPLLLLVSFDFFQFRTRNGRCCDCCPLYDSHKFLCILFHMLLFFLKTKIKYIIRFLLINNDNKSLSGVRTKIVFRLPIISFRLLVHRLGESWKCLSFTWLHLDNGPQW